MKIGDRCDENIYVYTLLCMYTFLYAHVYVSTYPFEYVYVKEYIYMNVSFRMVMKIGDRYDENMSVYTLVCMYSFLYAHVYVSTYTFEYIHVNEYIYI
jgi:hypothetical protein